MVQQKTSNCHVNFQCCEKYITIPTFNRLYFLLYPMMIIPYNNMLIRTYLSTLQRFKSLQSYCQGVKLCFDQKHFHFSTAKPKLNYRLNNLQQQALCSLTIINIIMTFSRENSIKEGMSLRELITNRQRFNKLATLILSNQKYSLIWNHVNEKWVENNISKQNYEKVTRGFQLKYGAYLDYRIWTQQRMSTLTQGGFVPLFPTLTTGLYYARLYRSCNTIFAGEKGIGKSFSFCSFSYLCSYMLEYRHHLINKNMAKIATKNASGELVISASKVSEILARDKICKIIKPHLIQLIPNLCYMNLKQEQDLTEYYSQLKLQFPNIASEQQLDLKFLINKNTKISLEVFKQILKHIKIIARQKGIKCLLVIDEANRLFRLLRQLSNSIKNNQQWKQSKTLKSLKFYNDLLEIVMERGQSKFDWVFLNSSQFLQLKFINELKQKQINQISKLTSLFIQSKVSDIGFNCKYSSQMQSQIGHFQLLNAFWFEIQSYFYNDLQKTRNILHDSQLLKHKNCFNKTFNIPTREQIQADPSCLKKMQLWKNDVRHLQIRQFLLNVKQNPPKCLEVTQGHIFYKENPSQAQFKQFSNGLKLLKASIQSYRLQNMASAILKYLTKTLSLQQLAIERFTILQKIQAEVELYVSQISQGSQTNKEYNYLQNSTFSNFDKQALVQSWGFGYFDTNKNSLTFPIDPQKLLLVIQKTNRKTQFTNIMIGVAHLMWFKGIFNPNLNAFLLRILDHINFYCFFKGKLSLKLKKYYSLQQTRSLNLEDKVLKDQFQQVQFDIINTIPFSGFKNLNEMEKNMIKSQGQMPRKYKSFMKTMERLLDEVNKNIDNEKFIGGFPAVFYQQDNFAKYSIHEDNQLFDCLLIRKNMNHNYEIVLIDWTMGRIENKYLKDFQELIRIFLKILNIKENIECSFIIAGPEYYVKEYFENKDNKSFKSILSQKGDPFVWEVQFMVTSFNQQLPFISRSQKQTQRIKLELLSAIYKNIEQKQSLKALKRKK